MVQEDIPFMPRDMVYVDILQLPGNRDVTGVNE